MLHRFRLLNNLLSLSGLQLVGSLIPFLVLPYVIEVIGLANFGVVSVAQSLALYGTLVVNYGFELTVTRRVSALGAATPSLSALFSEVLTAKSALLLLGSGLLAAVVFAWPTYRPYAAVIAGAHLANVGYVLYPSWLLQGLQNLKAFAVFNLAAKVLAYGIVVGVLRRPEQYFWLPLAISIGQVLVGVGACWYVVRRYGLSFRRPRFRAVVELLRRDASVFGAQLAMNLALPFNLLLLAEFGTAAAVGIFAAVAKIIVLISNLVHKPVTQTFFPHLAATFRCSVAEGFEQVRGLSWLTLAGGAAIALVLWAFPALPLKLLLRDDYADAVGVLRIAAPLALLGGLSQVWLVQTLLALRRDAWHAAVVVVSTALGVGLNYWLLRTTAAGAEAPAWGWLVVQGAMVALSFGLLARYYTPPLGRVSYRAKVFR